MCYSAFPLPLSLLLSCGKQHLLLRNKLSPYLPLHSLIHVMLFSFICLSPDDCVRDSLYPEGMLVEQGICLWNSSRNEFFPVIMENNNYALWMHCLPANLYECMQEERAGWGGGITCVSFQQACNWYTRCWFKYVVLNNLRFSYQNYHVFP